MGKYTQHNMDLISGRVRKSFTPLLLAALQVAADETSEYIDRISTQTGTDGLPMLTGALHDSTGVGLYSQGSLVYVAKPPKLFNLLESSEAMVDFEPATVLDMALKNTGVKTTNGIWFILFSSAPYAMEVDESGSFAKTPRGKGYFYDILVPFAQQAVERQLVKLRNK